MSEDNYKFHVEQAGDVSRETFAKLSKSCPICGSIQFKKLIDLKDHSISQENFCIYQCKQCELRITYPQPNNITSYYASDEYISHSKTNKGFINKLYLLAQTWNLAYKFRIAKKYSRGEAWMDYGSGAGDFLLYASKRHIDITGFEIHPESRKRCHALGLSVRPPKDYADVTEKFDLITMWHVLEHVENLVDVLAAHHNHLKPNATLIIAVPNPESYDANYYQSDWAAYDVPRHLWHFNEDNIEALAVKTGFALCQTLPLYLDAYYISMLSSKYQQGSYINALFRATMSNITAALKSTPYSSQIYILRKMAK